MVWKETKDAQGRVYYYSDTGATTWEKPEELFTELEKKLLVHGWKTAITEDGKTYYYKQSTGETTWNVPIDDSSEEVGERKEEEVKEEKESTDNVSSKVAKEVTKDAAESQSNDVDIRDIVKRADNEYTNKSELLVVSRVSSKEEAEAIFLQMLSEYEVDSTWSFNRIISEIGSKDPRYWIVDDDPLWKQAMFDKVLSNRTESQLLQEHQQLEKFQDAFTTMLSNLPNIHYYSRWSTVRRQISNEPIYVHSVIPESEKRRTFMKYVSKLKEERQNLLTKTKNEALKELNQYFTTITQDIDPLKVPWNKFSVKYLWGTARFDSNKNFKVLTKSDVLKEYIRIVKSKIPELNSKLAVLRSRNYRNDRHARDNFKKLLEELSDHIKFNSTWKHIYPLIKNDKRFLSMLGRNGSSALDLFLDKVEDCKLVVKAKCSIASQILNSQGLDLAKNSSEEVATAITQNPQFSETSKEDIDYIVSQLSISYEKRIADEKDKQYKMILEGPEAKAFETLLLKIYATKSLKSWEMEMDSFKGNPAFSSLPIDVAKLIFEKYQHNSRPARKRHLEEPKDALDLDY